LSPRSFLARKPATAVAWQRTATAVARHCAVTCSLTTARGWKHLGGTCIDGGGWSERGSWPGESMAAGDMERDLISRDWFRPGRPIVVGRAPARLDVMGGIADYSGATVLELPLGLGVWVAAQLGDDDLLAVRTDGPAVPQLARPDVSLPATVLRAGPPGEAPAHLRA